jgi:chromosome segregation ATPase
MELAMKHIVVDENATIEKVTKVFESIRSIITNHENELKQKIRTIEKRNKDLIKTFQEKLSDKQEELSKWNKEFEHTLLDKNYTKLLQDHQILIDYLTTTKQELNTMQHPIITAYGIEGIDQLQGTVADIIQRVCINEWEKDNLKFLFPDIL